MKILGPGIFRTIAILTFLCWQPSIAQETVFRATLLPPGPRDEGGNFPKIVTLQQVFYLSYEQEGATLPCKWNDRVNFDPKKCLSFLATTRGSDSFQVYRVEEIDTRLGAIGTQIDSLNKRIAGDEAGLPAAVDQYAVQKLLDKIATLEARVKTLEGQVAAHPSSSTLYSAPKHFVANRPIPLIGLGNLESHRLRQRSGCG
jgi:hypothetical protein